MDAADEGGGGSAEGKLFDFMDDDDEEKSSAVSSEGSEGKGDTADKGEGAAAEEGEEGADGGNGDEADEDSDSLFDGEGSESGEASAASSYTAEQLNGLAKELELLDDAGAGVSTLDELKTTFKAKLDASRKTVNLDDYSPATRRIVTMLESGMGEDAIFSNDKIIEANTIISMDEKEKVLESKILSLESAGMKPEEAEAKAIEIINAMSEEVIKGEAEKINGMARSVREAEIERMANEHRQHVESVNKQNEEKIKAEKQALLQEVKGLKEFMGIKIGEKTIATIEKAIEDGTFERTLKTNQAKSLVDAYLMNTIGKQLLGQLEKAAKESGEKNILAGMKKVIKHLMPEGKQRGESFAQGDADTKKKLPWAEE